MKKLAISFVLIRKFKVGEIAGKATVMNLAIFGNVLVFSGIIPFTEAEVAALITTYNSTKATYKVGGILQKEPYRLAKIALVNCILSIAGYVNKLADGNRIILELSTLPIDEPNDLAAKIAAGATAEGTTATQGATTGLLITDSAAFGATVGYITVVSEDEPKPSDLIVNNVGQVIIPANLTHRIFVSGTNSRRKYFYGCIITKKYYVTTILVYGDVVGIMSTPIMFVCSK